MWVGSLLAANRSGRLPFSARTGIDDHTRLTKKGSPRTDTRRRPPSSERRKAPESARHRRVALSRMASKMGCKSFDEFSQCLLGPLALHVLDPQRFVSDFQSLVGVTQRLTSAHMITLFIPNSRYPKVDYDR